MAATADGNSHVIRACHGNHNRLASSTIQRPQQPTAAAEITVFRAGLVGLKPAPEQVLARWAPGLDEHRQAPKTLNALIPVVRMPEKGRSSKRCLRSFFLREFSFRCPPAPYLGRLPLAPGPARDRIPSSLASYVHAARLTTRLLSKRLFEPSMRLWAHVLARRGLSAAECLQASSARELAHAL